MPREFTPDAEWLAAVEADCGCDLPDMAREAIAKFNAGEYYEQHDLFEALWMQTKSPVRQLYQAVLQVGIAYYQVEQGNWRGAVKMLDRALRWIEYLPGVCQGIDVSQLRANALELRAELIRVGDTGLETLDRSLFRTVPMVESR